MDINLFRVTNKILSFDDLKKIIEIDKLVYKNDYLSSLEQLIDRFNKNTDCFTTIYYDNELAGYICYFPIKKRLKDEIVSSKYLNDSDLSKDDILSYKDAEGTLYIISVAIKPEYQGSRAINILMSAFEKRVKQFVNKYNIHELIAITISEKGYNTLLKQGFIKISQLPNNTYIVSKKIFEEELYNG